MENGLIPDWVTRMEAEDVAKANAANAERQQKRVVRLLIAAKGPEFVQNLFRELDINARSLKDGLRQFLLQGSVDSSGDPRHEQRCRVSVWGQSFDPQQTYTDVIYTVGDPAIHCYTREGTAFKLPFRIYGEDGSEVGVMSEESPAPMDCKKVAQFIVERMVKLVREAG